MKIAQKFNLPVEALVVHSNTQTLNEQIAQFSPKYVAVGNESIVQEVHHDQIFVGEKGILELLEKCQSQKIVNALVGSSGVYPSVRVQQLGKQLILANKESLVVAGAFLDTSKIIPVDSEHFALWYLQNGRKVEKMTITASGGALRDWPLKKIPNARLQEVLAHPTWKMGAKITVDSASMANKLFELLEARWLFGAHITYDAVVEMQSLVHGFSHFKDGSITAHLSYSDMYLPIAFALLGEVNKPLVPKLDLLKMKPLTFLPIELKRYPIFALKKAVLELPKTGCIVNGANDLLNARFLQEQIAFGQIASVVLKVYDNLKNESINSVDDAVKLNFQAQKLAQDLIQA